MNTIHVEFNPYDISTIRFVANVQNCNVGSVSKEFEQILHHATLAQLTHVHNNYDNLEVATQKELKLKLIREEMNRKTRIQKPLADAGVSILGHSKAAAEKQNQHPSVAPIPITGERKVSTPLNTAKSPDEDMKELRPDYYGGEENPFEPFKIIEYYNLSFFAGNVLKYLLRAGVKDKSKHVEDLRKALTYLVREIMIVKKKKEKETAVNPKADVDSGNSGLYSGYQDCNGYDIQSGDLVEYMYLAHKYKNLLVEYKDSKWKLGNFWLEGIREKDLKIIKKYHGGAPGSGLTDSQAEAAR
jgi:hypothetical protein